ncbi:hypothetical protein [Photobacterium profundum]|uniref:Uncharacterized protein n=1 Tax=Photobacterium profundum 3TCK TaxID=314280 RepID=Q1Z6L9_9GAMM|nr:hypothetical protein [Photobacterium profundum]EAS44128.1 hypothetical protein P3TCK_10613 [Photobacterium profundum 3TCK]
MKKAERLIEMELIKQIKKLEHIKTARYIKDFTLYVELSNGERGMINCASLARQQMLFKQVVTDDKRDVYSVNNRIIQWYNHAYIHIEWIKQNMIALNNERPLDDVSSQNWRIKMKYWFIDFTNSDISEYVGFILIVVSFGIAGWLISALVI